MIIAVNMMTGMMNGAPTWCDNGNLWTSSIERQNAADNGYDYVAVDDDSSDDNDDDDDDDDDV